MENWKWRIKNRMYFVVISVFMIAAFFNLSVSAAEASLELQVEPALDGQIKTGERFPVKFTLTNHGDTISGFLTVRYAAGQSHDTVISQKVEIPQGSTQQIWLTLPGRQYTEANNEIVFMTGDPVDGKEVPFSNGDRSVEVSAVHMQTLQVGVFSSNPDTYNFLNLLGQKGYEVKVHPLDADGFSAELLQQLDVVAMNDFTSEHFSTEQIEALEKWVYQGGRLILSGGAGYSKIGTPLSDWSPVVVSGIESVRSLEALEQEAGQPLDASSGVTVAAGELREGQVILAADDIPLFASTERGLGEVWFVAYDVALEPLASWAGNSNLWERMLQDVLIPVNPQGGLIHRSNDYWELDRALNYFPKLKAPSFGMMAMLFFLYIVIAAPLLYFILKRMDKRGWAWFIIPSMALVFSAAIYVVGAWDRNETLAQHLDIVELYGDGTGHRTTAASYFVPSGGDYTLDYGQNKSLTPFSEKIDSTGMYELSGNVEELVTDGSLSFYDVPFWSIRKLWMEDRQIEAYGDLSIDISLNGNELVGEITNDTTDDLETVYIVYQNYYREVGSLSQGESKTFQLGLNQASGAHRRNLGYDLFPNQGSSDPNRQKRALLNAAFVQGDFPNIAAFGFSTNQQTVSIDGEELQADVNTLWIKGASLNYVHEGQILIPYGEINPTLVSFDDYGTGASFHIDQSQNYIELGDGELEIEFSYPLPVIEQAEYEKLDVKYQIPARSVTLEIWNESLGTWELLDDATTSITYSDPNAYLVDDTIRMRLTQLRGYYGFQLPEIMLEGRTLND